MSGASIRIRAGRLALGGALLLVLAGFRDKTASVRFKVNS